MFTANAQNVYQVQNSDFEEWEGVSYTTSGWKPTTYTGDEPLHWNSFLTGDGSLKGTAGRNQLEKSSEVRPGSTGNQSAKIFDRTVMGSIIAQGNLTTGRINMGSMKPADANGNYNFTITDDDAFNQKFTGRPDAMVVWVKYVSTGGFNAKANTVLHTEGYYQDPEGNTITATVIAKAENTSIASSNEWQKLTIPFDYKDAGRPAYALVSFATNVTPGKGTGKDYMLIDDLEYIYNYSLTSATYGATSLTVPAAGETADCGTLTYDEATELTLITDGAGASVDKAYDAESCVLTVTVKADDYEVSKHSNVYKFQFAKPAASVPSLASLKISGENFVLTEDVTEYELPYVYNKGIVFEPVAGEESTLGDVVYNDEDKTVSITVKNEKGAETVYVFRFGQLDETAAESGDYKGALSVVLITPEATSNGLLNNAAIVLSKNASGTYNLTLNDFAFMGMPVGNIFVPNIKLTDGKLEAQRTIIITSEEDGLGPMLGALPVKVSVNLVDTDKKAAAASIDILTSETDLGDMFESIHVDFVPYEMEAEAVDGIEYGGLQHYENVKVTGRVTKETAKFLHINNNYVNTSGETEEYPMTYIDMTAATVDADVTVADIMAGAPEKNNTLIYLPADSKLTDANTVVNGKAATLALTEKVTFFAPTAFEAASVHFDRTFNTADNYVSSFVMPFEMNVSEVKGDVYKFKGIDTEKNEVQFEKVNEGVLDANKPYLVVATDAAPLNAVANVNVAVTEDELAQTAGNAAHIGSYTVQTVTSDANATYYGYQNGEFVKANSGTLNPFRTMIKVTGAAGANVLTLKLEGTTTGINEAASETGKTDVYTIDGKCVRRGVAAKEALNGLAKGVYVVNGRKIVK